MNKIVVFLIFLLNALTHTESIAQSVVYSKEEKIPSKFVDYEIIGKNNFGTVVHYYGQNANQLAILDNKLNIVARKDINLQSNTIDNILLLDGKIVITYVQNTSEQQYCKALLLNENLNTIANYVLDSLSIKLDNKNKFYTKTSPDNSKIISFTIIKNRGNTHIRFASFDNDFNTLARNLFTLNGINNISVRSVKINNNGHVYGIFGHEDAWSNDEYSFNKYTILIYNQESKSIYESEIKEYNVAYKKLISDINLEDDIIYILCAYKNQVNRDNLGFYYRAIDIKSNAILYEKYANITEAEVKNSNTYEFKNWRDKVFTLIPKKIIPRSDGGFVFAVEGEFVYEIQETPNANNFNNPFFGIMPQTIRTIQKNSYGDIIIYSIDNKGNIDWKNFIYKSQQSQNDDGYRSSFSLFEANNVLKFIYNEDINNTGNFVEYNVNPIGKYKRLSLLNSFRSELNLLPRKAVQLDGNSILIPSESKRNVQFVKIIY